MNSSIDKKIITLLQTKEEEGMSLLMEEYMGLLWSACRLYLNNPEDIRECIQDTFTDFYEHRSRLDLKKGTLKAYLYVIAKRKAAKKSMKLGQNADEFDASVVKEENNDWVEVLAMQSALEEALEKLDKQDSQMIRMRYYNGMTCKEIAHQMNLPVETVKKRNQRSLKKLQKILIAVLILGILTACAATVIYRYRFSPLTGFQKNLDGEVWRVMSQEQITLQTQLGEVVIQNVVWKDQKLIIEVECDSIEYAANSYDMIKVYSESQKAYRTGNGYLIEYDEDSREFKEDEKIHLTYIRSEINYPNPMEAITLIVFGEKCVVPMQKIEQFEELSDIGQTQSHHGRTIILRKISDENGERLNAYTYSDDLWEITWLGELPFSEWKVFDQINRSYFTYSKDNLDELKTIDIETVNITAKCEDVKVTLDIPNEYRETDIPFFVGEDIYSIRAIWISEGTFEYGVGSTNEDEIIEYGDELMIKVEPVVVEENTNVFLMQASIGIEKERFAQVFKSNTGETEIQSVGYEFNELSSNDFEYFFVDENYEPTEIVLKFGFSKEEMIPEELVLYIDQVGKTWNQNYHFEIE